MGNTPTQAELMQFVEGALCSARTRQIERAAAADRTLAKEIDAVRADLQLAEELKAIALSGMDAETERRIARSLTSSVTNSVRNKTP